MDPGYCEVFSTSSAFILHKENSPEILYIDRSISTVTKRNTDQHLQGPSKKCFGLLGIIQLHASNYLILITQALHIARIKEHYVYLIKDLDFLPYTSLLSDSSNSLKDASIISLLKSLLLSDTFYFSYDYDLTLSVQKISSLSASSKLLHKWERSEDKFFWNRFLCENLIKAEAHEHILPVINGLVQGEYLSLSNKSFDYILISRRDKRRNGTRFNTRGLDEQGNAVNFVETEQLLCCWEENVFTIFSHVQIRGSIPLIWQQKPNLAWAPRPKISNQAGQSIAAAELHFQDVIGNYGAVALVNLIDKKGSQKMIGTVFSNVVSAQCNKQISYVWYDFHHECRNMKYENMRELLKQLEGNIREFGWCEVKVNGSENIERGALVKKQTGVFRTNCIDCLDRTNVVQSVIGRNVLIRQIASIGKGPEPNGEAFQAFSGEMETYFRGLWVKNADAMSILYSGTPAQKTDFTKMGKRTVKGAVADVVYGVQRYVINNFLDGTKQNTMDLLLGKLSMKSKHEIAWRFRALVVFLTILVGIVVVSWASARNSEGLSYWALFSIPFVLLGKLVMAYGKSFVDRPILGNN